MVMREIDAGGTVFRAAIEAGDEELEHEVLAAFEVLGAEFGDMAFMLADLARAAGEIQDSLGSQDAELRAARMRTGRQSADVRMIREKLAVIDQRAGQWRPEQPEPSAAGPRWVGGCPYRGLLPYDQAHAAVFCGRERPVPSPTNPSPASSGLATLGASRSSRSAPRASLRRDLPGARWQGSRSGWWSGRQSPGRRAGTRAQGTPGPGRPERPSWSCS